VGKMAWRDAVSGKDCRPHNPSNNFTTFFFSLFSVNYGEYCFKTRAVRSGGRLEGWFSGDNELIERYRFETSTKVINNLKVVSFDWLKSQKLDNVRKFLKDQLL